VVSIAFATWVEGKFRYHSAQSSYALHYVAQGRDDFNLTKTYMNAYDKTNCVLACICVASHYLVGVGFWQLYIMYLEKQNVLQFEMEKLLFYYSLDSWLQQD
jgi:hypothetical protein